MTAESTESAVKNRCPETRLTRLPERSPAACGTGRSLKASTFSGAESATSASFSIARRLMNGNSRSVAWRPLHSKPPMTTRTTGVARSLLLTTYLADPVTSLGPCLDREDETCAPVRCPAATLQSFPYLRVRSAISRQAGHYADPNVALGH